MRKVFGFAIMVLLLTVALCACNTTFDGYYYNLDDVRKVEKSYANCDYLFTVEHDDQIVDFIIKGETVSIIKIHCRGEAPHTQYRAKSTVTFPIEESLYDSQVRNKYYWNKSGNYPIQVEWLIVSKEFNDSRDKFMGFEFEYKDVLCCLCYRIGE